MFEMDNWVPYVVEQISKGESMKQKDIEQLQVLIEESNSDAMVELAKRYYTGKGVTKDYEKAMYYFERSLDERHDDAYFYLGEIYQNGGYGVEKDIKNQKNISLKLKKTFVKPHYII